MFSARFAFLCCVPDCQVNSSFIRHPLDRFVQLNCVTRNSPPGLVDVMTILIGNSLEYWVPRALGSGGQCKGLRACGDRTDATSLPAPWSTMGYRITLDRGVLRAELFGRETIEETNTFFQHPQGKQREPLPAHPDLDSFVEAGISARAARLIEYFGELAETSPRIALLGDSRDLRFSHEYVELIADCAVECA